MALVVGLAATVLIPAAAGDTIAPPTITLNVTGLRGDNGWFLSNVTASWTVSDPTGISGSTGCTTTILAAETAGTTLTCTATNNAVPPLTSSVSATFKIDKTAPTVVSANPQRPADAHGWYNHPVSFSFTASDALSGDAGCSGATYSGADDAAASVTTTCRDKAGNTASRSFELSYDSTGPVLSPAAARPADHDGWYNHPVAVQFGGNDAVSGIDTCSSASYSGPDSAQAAIAGSCRDRAGNVTPGNFVLKYDATAPKLKDVYVKSLEHGNVVRWKSSSSSDTVVIRRVARGARSAAIVFNGGGAGFEDTKIRPGREYTYSVQSSDEAGNESQTVSRLGLPKVLLLGQGAYVPRAADEPILKLPTVRVAHYYHVQLFRGSTRILAAWPQRPELRLHDRWTWAGHVYRLRPGTYRWWGWAGLGKRSAARYRLLGSGRFIVPQARG